MGSIGGIMDTWLWITGITLILMGMYLIRRAWRMGGLPDMEDVQDALENLHNKYKDDLEEDVEDE